jgi:DnaJ-class molecular chaperone
MSETSTSRNERRKNQIGQISGKVPAPCERCGATGIFHGSECVECRGKGYRMIQGAKAPPRANDGNFSAP